MFGEGQAHKKLASPNLSLRLTFPFALLALRLVVMVLSIIVWT